MTVADASASFSPLPSVRPLTFTPNLLPFTRFVRREGTIVMVEGMGLTLVTVKA